MARNVRTDQDNHVHPIPIRARLEQRPEVPPFLYQHISDWIPNSVKIRQRTVCAVNSDLFVDLAHLQVHKRRIDVVRGAMKPS